MKRSCKVFILLPIVPLLIAGCVGVTPYQEADSKGYGVKTYKMSDNRYRVVVTATPQTDIGTAEGYFWRRAQDICGCPGAVHGDLLHVDRIESCLSVSKTKRIEGHPEKVTEKVTTTRVPTQVPTQRGGAVSSSYQETKVDKEEDTEVSGEVECLKESK